MDRLIDPTKPTFVMPDRWDEEWERTVRAAVECRAEDRVQVAVLVTWDDPDETPSDAIGRLNSEAVALANQLLAHGITPDDRYGQR